MGRQLSLPLSTGNLFHSKEKDLSKDLLRQRGIPAIFYQLRYNNSLEIYGGFVKHPLVDLTLLNKATPLLAYEVIHGGSLLFSRSEDLRIEFEISSQKRHAGTKHLRDIKRVYSEERTAKGFIAHA